MIVPLTWSWTIVLTCLFILIFMPFTCRALINAYFCDRIFLGWTKLCVSTDFIPTSLPQLTHVICMYVYRERSAATVSCRKPLGGGVWLPACLWTSISSPYTPGSFHANPSPSIATRPPRQRRHISVHVQRLPAWISPRPDRQDLVKHIFSHWRSVHVHSRWSVLIYLTDFYTARQAAGLFNSLTEADGGKITWSTVHSQALAYTIQRIWTIQGWYEDAGGTHSSSRTRRITQHSHNVRARIKILKDKSSRLVLRSCRGFLE